ncbi:unnamed protein product [Durusdinium trenchii]|uniref:Core domain-containing protein n=1 Tax=Durusdinium trenchii TaxID=1381693 RepID=A0ABP0SSV5_9DINO
MEPKEDDIVIQQEGARLIVDELSMTFLEDCEIDYTEEMIRASFSVVKNKLADSKCGCGSSFSALVGRRWSPGSVAVERGRCGGGVSLVPCAANGSWRPPRATRRAQVSPRSERSFQGRLASSLSAMEEWQAEPSSDLWNESVGWKQVKCSSWRVPLQGRRSGIWV